MTTKPVGHSDSIRPLMASIFPFVLAGLGCAGFVGAIVGGLTATRNEVAPALLVMTPITVLVVAAAYGLRKGTSWGYGIWTFGLGVLVFAASISFVAASVDQLGFVAALCFFASAIYVAVARKRDTISSTLDWVYLSVVVLAVTLGLIIGGSPAIGPGVFVVIVAGLVVATYAVPLRRWCGVGPFQRIRREEPSNHPLQPTSGA